jgi:uncharacterized phage infection (PIP) family protein YhgE
MMGIIQALIVTIGDLVILKAQVESPTLFILVAHLYLNKFDVSLTHLPRLHVYYLQTINLLVIMPLPLLVSLLSVDNKHEALEDELTKRQIYLGKGAFFIMM